MGVTDQYWEHGVCLKNLSQQPLQPTLTAICTRTEVVNGANGSQMQVICIRTLSPFEPPNIPLSLLASAAQVVQETHRQWNLSPKSKTGLQLKSYCMQRAE